MGVDVRHRRTGVLGDIGERFGDDVVGGDFDLRGQPAVDVDVELDWDRGATRKGLERGLETSLREDRRMDAARDLLQFFNCLRQALRNARECRALLSQVDRDTRLRGTQLDAE